MPNYIESLSSAHLEAMRRQMPQMSSDLLFVRSLYSGASTDVPADDPLAWLEAMERLAENSALQTAPVAKGSGRFAHFPAKCREIARSHRSLFATICEEHARRAEQSSAADTMLGRLWKRIGGFGRWFALLVFGWLYAAFASGLFRGASGLVCDGADFELSEFPLILICAGLMNP
jgi:hypothetical protein